MGHMKLQIEKTTAETIAYSEDDICISDTGTLGGLYTTDCDDFSDQYSDLDELVADIRAAMVDDGYHANIWYVDDHGGRTLQIDDDSELDGYSWRLSAPGYLDATDWCEHETELDCINDAVEMFGDDNDILLEAITYLHDMVENSLFMISATVSDYNGTIELLQRLAELADEWESEDDDNSDLWAVGEYGHASLDNLMIGVYWFCTEYHSGQNSAEYALLSAVGSFFSPGMSSGPEDETSEKDVFNAMVSKIERQGETERIEGYKKHLDN